MSHLFILCRNWILIRLRNIQCTTGCWSYLTFKFLRKLQIDLETNLAMEAWIQEGNIYQYHEENRSTQRIRCLKKQLRHYLRFKDFFMIKRRKIRFSGFISEICFRISCESKIRIRVTVSIFNPGLIS